MGVKHGSLTLRGEPRLRVLENRVLRRKFGPKRDEVMGGWRKLHNGRLRDLYSSPSIVRMIKSRRMRWEGHVARMGEKRNACRLLVGKPEEKRPLGRPRRRWVNNIGMDLGEIGWGGVGWIGLAQDRNRWRALVNAGKLSSGLSSSAQLHTVSQSVSQPASQSVFFCLSLLCPMACFPSEGTYSYGPYRQQAGLPARQTMPLQGRYLHSHASSGIRPTIT
jgi:hypothetical protein